MIHAIIFLPLIAAIWVGLSTASMSVKKAQRITCGAVVLAALFSIIVFCSVVLGKKTYSVELFRWIDTGDFIANWTLYVDSLTAIMLVLVTGVSALVHIYSVGYMSHDPHIQRFMAYLSLFTFSMLMLVTSNNFLQLFFGWEGVGLCSYLLIGFWYHKDSAKAAAMKAFIVNRVGDFGLILGIFTIYMVFGTLSFAEVFAQVPQLADKVIQVANLEFNAVTFISILLFIGAMGKSAQLGLHTWLPDAMEGPTPVSALIHAATMVTAGVFLVARCSPLYEYAPLARDMVTIVGAATALFAATIAVTQNDIKRIIAYSTCSQLGYMFFACGVSAYAAGIFHLFTHGFFKALLFLGAGSVIHAMSDEQDIRNMGGIYKKIPFTYAVMLIGTIAIVGFPPLSGYFSKDMILESAYAAGAHGNGVGELAYWLGITAALLTSFYSWRLIFLTFHGQTRASKEVYSHIHESPKVMTIPLFILALGALFVGGLFSLGLGIVNPDLAFWNGALAMQGKHNILEQAHHVPMWVKFSPLVVGLVGLGLAYLLYLAKPQWATLVRNKLNPLYLLSYNKWYVDELYDAIFVRPAKWLGRALWKWIDMAVIDNLGPNGMAKLSLKSSQGVAWVQNGLIYTYAFVMLTGLLLSISYYVWKYLL